MKNVDHDWVQNYRLVHRFLNDSITRNENKSLSKGFKGIDPGKWELKKENKNHNVATFLNLSAIIKKG